MNKFKLWLVEREEDTEIKFHLMAASGLTEDEFDDPRPLSEKVIDKKIFISTLKNNEHFLLLSKKSPEEIDDILSGVFKNDESGVKLITYFKT